MVIILCGPSGVGKTTIAKSLDVVVPTALTTRPKRHCSEEIINTQLFPPEAECALYVTYGNNDYIITKSEMQRCMSSGKRVLVVAAGEGILQLRRQYKCIVVYIYSMTTFEKRRPVNHELEAWHVDICDFAVDRMRAVPFLETLLQFSDVKGIHSVL